MQPAAKSDLAELACLDQEQRRLKDRERQVVDALAGEGIAWPVIAAVLGISRQGARQRFLRPGAFVPAVK